MYGTVLVGKAYLEVGVGDTFETTSLAQRTPRIGTKPAFRNKSHTTR